MSVNKSSDLALRLTLPYAVTMTRTAENGHSGSAGKAILFSLQRYKI